jgi:plastocyanin domain-containing protein
MKARFVLFGGILLAIASVAWGCAKQSASGSQTVKVAVTDRGFEPAEIKVRSGRPVTLLVTRTTDSTCVKEIMIADAHVRQALPLNQEVRVTFTPEKPGEIRYACGMDMVAGSVKVQ